MKNKKKRPNKFRIRLFIIFWIALVIPCMLISYILYQNSQEKSKQSMAEDIQHTLTENMASVEGKLDAVSDAGVSLKFAMEQNNVVMIPDLKCRDIDIYSLVQKTFSTYTSLLDETYNVGGNNERNNLEIVHAVCAILDKYHPCSDGKKYEALISFVTDRPGHDLRYAIDANKLKNDLGWKANENFDTGIVKTIAWYLNEKKFI